MRSAKTDGASSQAGGQVCRFWVRLVGVWFESVVCGGVGSGRVGTGYEVGGWGERHGAFA